MTATGMVHEDVNRKHLMIGRSIAARFLGFPFGYEFGMM